MQKIKILFDVDFWGWNT